MKVAIAPDGKSLQFIHSDERVAMLSPLGEVSMRRASHVEPWRSLSDEARGNFIHDHELDQCADYTQPHPNDPDGTLISATSWYADMSPVGGRTLGPFPTKQAALAAEVDWIESHALCPTSNSPSNCTSSVSSSISPSTGPE